VLAGRLRALDREQAELLATRLGGTCVQVVDEATDLIVMGEPRAGEAVDPRQASGQAERLRSAGIMIRLVNEDEFLGLVICNEQGS
jgi:BRCT domain type II-containing protein